MNIINKKLLIFLMTIMFCQFQLINLKADDTTNIDDEELPAIDPFAGGVGSTNQVTETDNSQMNSNSGLLNNMRLVGTVIGENPDLDANHYPSSEGGVIVVNRRLLGQGERYFPGVISQSTNKTD